MTKKGQFVSTLLASMAANLVWNLNPGVESTVRQLRPHIPYIGRSLWEFPAGKSSTSFPSTLCLMLFTPTEFLASYSYASIHSGNAGFLMIAGGFQNICHIISNSAKLWDLAKTEYQLLPYFPSPKGSFHISLPVKCHMGFHRFILFGFFV